MVLAEDYRTRFLARLVETGNVSEAARRTGIARETAYGWRWDDADFAAEWDRAVEVARQGLYDRVAETASAMGLGVRVPVLDEDGSPVVDDEFEPVTRLDVSGVDARVLIKLLDKTMRDEVRRVDQRTVLARADAPEDVAEVEIVDVDGRPWTPGGGGGQDEPTREAVRVAPE